MHLQLSTFYCVLNVFWSSSHQFYLHSDDLDDDDVEELEQLNVFGNNGEDVYQILATAVANIQQLDEMEEFLLEGMYIVLWRFPICIL